MRVYPEEFLEDILYREALFDGNILREPGKSPIFYAEGVSAAQEAADKIRAQMEEPRKAPLEWSDGIFLAIRDHCQD
jgi:hypothetical protein